MNGEEAEALQGPGISRRRFIGGAATLATASALGLAGCSKPQSQVGSGDTGTESLVATSTVEEDIVVVGAGAAGMLAAYEAGKAGVKNVLVISNSKGANDTNGSMVSGTAAVQTHYTKDAGETYTIDQVFGRMIAFAHWTVNARLLKTCVEYLPGNIDVFDEMGIALALAGDRYSIGFKEVHLFGTDGKGQVMQDYIAKKYGVKFQYATEAEELIVKDDKIVGVRVTDGNGDVIDIEAGAVLLACGGHMDNPDMLQEIYGDMDIVACTSGHQDGKGIKMAQTAGAFRESTYGLGMNDIFGSSAKLGFNMQNGLLSMAFYGGLIVNQNGERFMNEYMLANESMAGGGEATLHAERYYAIYGQDVIDGLKKAGYYQYIGSPAFWNSGMLLYSKPIDGIDGLVTDAVKQGWCYKGDTVAEVAKAAGLADLEETVAAYDKMALAGNDTLFYKNPAMMRPVETGGPYYLIEYNPGAFNTFGGCRTDHLCRALRADFSVIDGLYIAGVENGSLYSRPYYDVGGTCSGLSYSSGRLAGQQMAAYVK